VTLRTADDSSAVLKTIMKVKLALTVQLKACSSTPVRWRHLANNDCEETTAGWLQLWKFWKTQ